MGFGLAEGCVALSERAYVPVADSIEAVQKMLSAPLEGLNMAMEDVVGHIHEMLSPIGPADGGLASLGEYQAARATEKATGNAQTCRGTSSARPETRGPRQPAGGSCRFSAMRSNMRLHGTHRSNTQFTTKRPLSGSRSSRKRCKWRRPGRLSGRRGWPCTSSRTSTLENSRLPSPGTWSTWPSRTPARLRGRIGRAAGAGNDENRPHRPCADGETG